ncbi:hypothetical protein Dda_0321 [Drechslerella dactyloides]|uniref:Uncharacterized protein n=1 Tax=Drechslerella dactyloides TaxID=74499 RepID=A0AAD6J4D4_DREDA|nr:hypothetical protein Dda_0321 [Drechslerella dactyloides]
MDSQYARPPPNPDVYQTPDVDLAAAWDAASARNKTFLITGGLSGIGAGIATQLAALGSVILCCKRPRCINADIDYWSAGRW